MDQIVLLTQQKVAEILGIRAATLEKWRVSGRGPRFRKVGALVRYDQRDLEQYLDNARRSSTADDGRRKARSPVGS